MEFSESRAAADLEWLRRCPDLLCSDAASVLDREIAHPPNWSAVKRFLDTKAARRVGYYVESLFQAWLESNPEVSGLEHGIQIRRGKETLGELDFLFRREGELQHLEVALKFYLCYPERAENGSAFVGPNASDSFERKRDRLLGKQLPFGKTFYPEIEKSFHAVKGMIFYHWSRPESPDLPDLLNPAHARGVWLRQREVEAFLTSWSSEARARVLKKPFWLAAGGPERSADELREAVQAHFARWNGPVFFGLFEGGEERERVFIVPDFWPAKDGRQGEPGTRRKDLSQLAK